MRLVLLLSAIVLCAGCPREKAPPVTPRTQPQRTGAGWQPAGFGGAGAFLSVHAHPRRKNVVYAASDVAGVLRSTDGGGSWEIRSVGLGNYEVASLALDAFEPDTLYAGVGAYPKNPRAGLYVSRDAGASWQHLPSSAQRGIFFRKFRTVDSIAPDPTRPRTLLVGSVAGGVWRTTDGGKTFSRVLEAPTTQVLPDMPDGQDEVKAPYPAFVSFVRFDPSRPQRVYAGIYGVGIYRSEQAGAGGWQSVSDGLPPSPQVKDLAIGPGTTLYAALGKAGVYRSDGGRWRAVNTDLPLKQGWIPAVVVDPRDPNLALVAVASYEVPNVWRTTDGGKRWVGQDRFEVEVQHNPTRLWSRRPTLSFWLSLDPADPKRAFLTDYWGISRSDDGGVSWRETVQGALNTCVTSLLVEGSTVYSTYMDAGLLRSGDGGASWTPVMPRSYDAKLAGHYWRYAIARGATTYHFTTLDPWNHKHSRVLRSEGGDAFWDVSLEIPRATGNLMGGALLGLAVDPSASSTVYVSQDGGKVWVTRDSGKTWRPTDGQPGGSSHTGALAVDGANRVFAGMLTDGLWRSADGGKTWRRLLPKQDTIWQVLPAGDALYVSSGGDANLHRSRDGGETWQRLTDFRQPDPGDGVGEQGMAIAIDPRDPKHIVFSRLDTSHSADASSGLTESRDGGVTWRSANEGLGLLNIGSLAFAADGTLYAGTRCGGVWRRAP
jgi:photosystem II stability/assembly factor-like uncharacterized protein